MLSRLTLRLRGKTARLLHAPAPTGATPPAPPARAMTRRVASTAFAATSSHVDRRLESTAASFAAALGATFPARPGAAATAKTRDQPPLVASPSPAALEVPRAAAQPPVNAVDVAPVNAGDVEAAHDRAAAADASDASRRSGPVVAEAESQRKYHFEVRGAEAKRDFDRSKVKCMCHEVAAAAALRSRNTHAAAAAAAASSSSSSSSSSSCAVDDTPTDAASENINDFFVFNRTTLADILAAKHRTHTYWGSNHWCDASEPVAVAVRRMNSQDVGALLVMDRSLLDVDGDERVTEAEFRASPQTSAMRGIVTERDYLRAVARGAVSPGTAVGDIMTDFATDNGAGLISASPDTSVLAAMEIMTEARIRHIPCIAPPSRDGPTGAVMEGMVCIGDVIKALLAEEREEVQICRDFINGVYD